MDIDMRQPTQAGPIGYLTLVVAAFVIGNPTPRFAANVVFGLMAVLLGVVMLRIPADSQLRYAAGGGFLLAGVSQFAELATGVQSVGSAGMLSPLAGLLSYLALRRETGAMPF